MKKKRQDRDERRDQMKKKRQDRRWKTREDQREDLKREEARQLFFSSKLPDPRIISNFQNYRYRPRKHFNFPGNFVFVRLQIKIVFELFR